jgi:hypothetical protein
MISRETLVLLRFAWPHMKSKHRKAAATRCLFLTIATFNGHTLSKRKMRRYQWTSTS